MTKKLLFWILICLVTGSCESRVYVIPSPNMEGTLPVGSRIFVGFDEPQRNDIIVFKFPEDKTTPYIKRMVAIPGDTIAIVDAEVFTNGTKQNYPSTIQHRHILKTEEVLRDRFFEERNISERNRIPTGYMIMVSDNKAEELKKLSLIEAVEKQIQAPEFVEIYMWPSDYTGWNRDQFGPLYIPKAGDVVTGSELMRYNKLVKLHEGQDISNLKAYTFKKSYCFTMGDNRHNSLDSRYWGLVPMEDVIGKAELLEF